MSSPGSNIIVINDWGCDTVGKKLVEKVGPYTKKKQAPNSNSAYYRYRGNADTFSDVFPPVELLYPALRS